MGRLKRQKVNNARQRKINKSESKNRYTKKKAKVIGRRINVSKVRNDETNENARSL